MSKTLRSAGTARKHSFVPRAVLAYAGMGLGMSVVPLCPSCSTSSEPDAPSIGIYPALVDASDGATEDAASVGIRLEVFDASDGASDAAEDASDAAEDASDASDDASDAASIGIHPAVFAGPADPERKVDGPVRGRSSPSDAER